jgi:hypothetical protein
MKMTPPWDVAKAAQVSTISFHSPSDCFHSTVSLSTGKDAFLIVIIHTSLKTKGQIARLAT